MILYSFLPVLVDDPKNVNARPAEVDRVDLSTYSWLAVVAAGFCRGTVNCDSVGGALSLMGSCQLASSISATTLKG